MLYWYSGTVLPRIASVYTVTRRTVWEIADSYHILLYVQNGQCRIDMDGHSYILTAGDLLYIPADTWYKRMPVDDVFCHMLYLHFSLATTGKRYGDVEELAAALRHEYKTVQMPPAFILPLQPIRDPEDCFEQIMQIRRYHIEGGAFGQQTAAYQLAALLSAITVRQMRYVLTRGSGEGKEWYPAALKRALTYIQEHENEPISLDNLSAAAFVSKQMLIRHFNKVFGKSPTVYMTEYKINRIKQMLVRYPQMSVKEICGEFGYEDQCYFSRMFKKYVGETPTAYRRRVNTFNEKKHLAAPKRDVEETERSLPFFLSNAEKTNRSDSASDSTIDKK